MSQVSPSRIAERLLLGAFPLLTLDTPDTFINLVEYFESGRRRSSGSAPMLGQRPVISRNPLKLADHYVWWSWDQVDVRRRHLGSALYRLFADGVGGVVQWTIIFGLGAINILGYIGETWSISFWSRQYDLRPPEEVFAL